MLLPPANEVWGKVVFLHLCIILFTVGSASRGVRIQGGLPPGGGGLHPGGRGICIQGEKGLHPGGGLGRPPSFGYYGIRSTSGRYASLLECILVEQIITPCK